MSVQPGSGTVSAETGDFHSHPLAVLLAHACDRKASGTFTFAHRRREEVLVMRDGKIAAVRTSEPVAYLGSILYELGAIDMATLNETLQEVATAGRLHGDILVERGACARSRIDE